MTLRSSRTATLFALIVVAAFAGAAFGIPTPPRSSLQIYFVDVEGGQATLFITADKHYAVHLADESKAIKLKCKA